MNKRASVLLCGLILSLGSSTSAQQADIVIADFSGASYGNWKATGDAFRHGPADAALATKLELQNFVGKGVATTKIDGDKPTGTLTSPEFTIERKYIAFRISGGNYEFSTCMNLLVDGQIVHSATGANSIHLTPTSWDVSALIGRKATLQIVDVATGDWGHIDVDHIVQTDAPQRLPVEKGALYQELFRPQFHFTARQWTMDRLNPGQRQEGWINDLNGLIYYDSEYHLFAQRWAKCWLHAVSKDLVHWTELQPAFWEEKLDSGVQSGTCVVDYKNTSGLSPDPKTPPLIAFWPRFDNHSQCMSYSLDHGRTWTPYAKNPIFDHPERDPKVFWYEPAKHWVMMLYGDRKYHVLTSTNLVDWKDENKPIANCFECPDFFELPVDGKADQKKWVLIQGSGKYSIGTFDGTEFKEETERFSCDIGPNFYATQSWSNTETGDGRRIQVAWMRGGIYPNMPFNQQISFPCILSLHSTPKGMRLFREPIAEIKSLEQTPDMWASRTLNAGGNLVMESVGGAYEVQAEVSIPENAKLTFNLLGSQMVLTSNRLESGTQRDGQARETLQSPVKTVHILVDRSSIEVFINHGEISMSRCFLPRESTISVRADGGAVQIQSLKVFPLKSAWEKQ